MAHKIGNNPKCIDCKYYQEHEGDTNKGKCTAGKKILPVNWCDSCLDWIDKDTGLTHFEVLCRVPEPKRSEADIEYLSRFITWRPREEWHR